MTYVRTTTTTTAFDISDYAASSVNAQPQRAAPSVDDSEAFPTLGGGGGGGTRRPQPTGGAAASSGGGWSNVASRPAVTPLYTSSSAAAAVAPPPRSFEAQPEEFPSLGNVATVARVSAPDSIPKDRDELIARNKALMAALSQAARVGGNADALTTFRTLSQAFQKGELTSMAYFSQFRQLFGEAVTAAHFPELVLLLPDQLKREELVRIYDAFDRSRPLHAGRAAAHVPLSQRGGQVPKRGAMGSGWGS